MISNKATWKIGYSEASLFVWVAVLSRKTVYKATVIKSISRAFERAFSCLIINFFLSFKEENKNIKNIQIWNQEC